MVAHVNLDALIPREDFEVVSNQEGNEPPPAIKISDLEPKAFFYNALRKPDFQRETAEWTPDRVCGLVATFIEGGLIPGVILWRNKDLLFVIDGSHRLSALIAWVHDDYGSGDRSQLFFGYDVPAEQSKIARRTKELIEQRYGSYQDHKDLLENPERYGPDLISRARRFGSLALNLQWVRGDAKSAETSFIRINQQAAIIQPKELAFIEGRRKPNTIAARAIVRRATGHQYWSQFPENERNSIRDIATDIHRMIFEPPISYPIKKLDLPAGGPVYSSTALPMVYDFVEKCTGAPSPEPDTSGKRTVECLQRTKRVMQSLLSNHSSSLGLHPAVYFYSWTGKQQPILFLAIADLIIDFERTNKLGWFIEQRGRLESFLIEHRSLLNQLIRKFGTKESGQAHLRRFYDTILKEVATGKSDNGIVEALRVEHSYLQPEESPYDAGIPSRYSRQARSGLILRDLLPHTPKCAICGGLIPSQSISVDHKERREDGGLATVENAQLTHPYCNSGYKEKQVPAARARVH